MGADVIRTELKASGDRRVRAGLRGAIEHLAGRHGMSAAEQREFANEVDGECCKLSGQGEAVASCEVVIEEQEDQLEVKVGPLAEPTLTAQTREAASAESSKHHPDAKHARHDGLADRSSDNGHFAATLVRHFHGNATRS